MGVIADQGNQPGLLSFVTDAMVLGIIAQTKAMYSVNIQDFQQELLRILT